MDVQSSWSNRTETAMEANDVETINVDQGATLPASPASRSYYDKYFADNFVVTRRAIQGRNAYATWPRKLGITKKGDPEFLRIHEEL
ncbi:hypothetical protein NPIL_151421 [Nephila pilipes]|uniref:Uncharacterized protein n=1 Tax=Nephila pilipes TaxID=299642 RepID=A0A8X6UI34_NEPPI|nr:hypothetical protein NPIL_151421 [Nephila pilipes]